MKKPLPAVPGEVQVCDCVDQSAMDQPKRKLNRAHFSHVVPDPAKCGSSNTKSA
jgi:hypothetical protein